MTDRNALPSPPATGRRDLDLAHLRLQGSMEDLWRALERGNREEAMTCTVGVLAGLRADYLGEESLMRRSAFPDLDKHLETHAALESGFVALVRRIRDGGPDLGPAERDALRAALRRLAGDLAAHVRSADCALARFLDSAGVSDRA
jgi:hemerythrin